MFIRQYFIQGPPAKFTPKKEPQVQFKAVVCLGTYFSREILKTMEIKQRLFLSWYLQHIKNSKAQHKRPDFKTKTRQITFIEAILICLCHTRDRSLWMHPRSFTWIEMVEQPITRSYGTPIFESRRKHLNFCWMDSIGGEIYHPDTVMRSSIPIQRRLAITLYFLASTAEYRTIANLFGVSQSFVCTCVKDVCRAITNCLSKVISFPQGDQ